MKRKQIVISRVGSALKNWKCWVSPLAIALLAAPVFGQTQLSNGDFEEWTLTKGSGNFKDYEEPSNGWSSGNGVIHVAPNTNPVVVKSTDAAVGNYSAKLITQSIFGQIAAGSLFIGRFKLNLTDFAASAILGASFTDRPTKFRGHYKYTPANGDSATMYARLTRWTGTAQVVVGQAVLTEYGAVSEWRRFDIPFQYNSGATPDSIRVVLASSAGGENFKGEIGSTLFVDNVQLDYTPLSVDNVPRQSVDDALRLLGNVIEISCNSAAPTVVRIVNSCGMLVRELTTSSEIDFVDCTSLPRGVYFASAFCNNFTTPISLLFTVCH
ncbi:MAG: PCMD domain-containing protein [Ignavibacteria bacterium]|nr:PCMD domain-containing protein [Ignavibacteria bacterium]